MNKREFQKLLDTLWEKHGHPDKHGYRDWMAPSGFDAACRELLELLADRVKKAVNDSR